jgi:hypothetical protein
MMARPRRSRTGGPASRDQSATGTGPGDKGTGSGPGGVPPGRVRAAPSHLVITLAGLREPIVVILLIIGFMTWISGKPLDGLLILLAGASLAWDAGRRSRQAVPAEAGPASASPAEAGHAEASPGEAGTAAAGPAAREDGVLMALLVAWLAGGVLYAVVVGSFSRYSWPATVPVAGLGAAVVAIGWRYPRHPRPAPARPPAAGLALWGLVFVAGCLWELWSLLEQPNLATSSYAHPTISTLTDPVLSTWAGRSVVLAGWLGLGWFLVER